MWYFVPSSNWERKFKIKVYINVAPQTMRIQLKRKSRHINTNFQGCAFGLVLDKSKSPCYND